MEPKNLDGIEYIGVVSRRGHFNWAKPEQETVSTHIAVVTETKDQYISRRYINITTEEIITSNNIDEMISLIDNHINWWFNTSRDEEIKFRNYLVENQDRLDYGNNLKRFNQILKQNESLVKELNVLSKEIHYYEQEQSKFVNGAWITVDQRRP